MMAHYASSELIKKSKNPPVQFQLIPHTTNFVYFLFGEYLVAYALTTLFKTEQRWAQIEKAVKPDLHISGIFW